MELKNENKRFAEIRLATGLSQEVFGERIGLSKSGISNIESGSRKVTEKHIKLLNAAFNVSEIWLRTGHGQMFIEQDVVDMINTQAGLDEQDVKLIKTYMSMSKEKRKAFRDSFRVLAEMVVNMDSKDD